MGYLTGAALAVALVAIAAAVYLGREAAQYQAAWIRAHDRLRELRWAPRTSALPGSNPPKGRADLPAVEPVRVAPFVPPPRAWTPYCWLCGAPGGNGGLSGGVCRDSDSCVAGLRG